MAGNLGLALGEGFDEMADAEFSCLQKSQDSQASRVGEGLEKLGMSADANHIWKTIYIEGVRFKRTRSE